MYYDGRPSLCQCFKNFRHGFRSLRLWRSDSCVLDPGLLLFATSIAAWVLVCRFLLRLRSDFYVLGFGFWFAAVACYVYCLLRSNQLAAKFTFLRRSAAQDIRHRVVLLRVILLMP